MDHPFLHTKWIGSPHCPEDTAPVFCKSFFWDGTEPAILHITGVGFYDARCNGRPVSDALLNPAFTRYDKTVYYNTFDITPCLRVGENTLEVTLGNGWYNQMQADAWQFEHAVWKSTPRMLCALYQGESCVLVSDSSWLSAPSAVVFNSLRCGETFDARIVEPDWKKAQVVRAPGGVLKPQTIEPIRVRRVLEPVAIVPSDTPVVYDFGINLSGDVEICVEGPRGAKIKILYAEEVLNDGYLARDRSKMFVYTDRFQQDEYILRGEGKETWHSRFGYNGFRYANVIAPKSCRIHSVRARQFHTDLADAGGFVTDDPALSRLLAAIRQSSLTNFHHIPTDCPHREKNGWTGDAWLSCRQMLYNFDMRKAYEKWLDDIVDCQLPSGQIPCIVPTSAWGYDLNCGITWDIALLVIPWEMYRFYGDKSVLSRYAGAIRRYMTFLTDCLDDGIPAFGLGDWCAPHEVDKIPVEALRAAMAVYAGRIEQEMGNVLGEEEMVVQGRSIAEECAAAFRRDYGEATQYTGCQLYFALRLLFSLGEDAQADLDALVSAVDAADGHIWGGIFTARFVPEALSRFGRMDKAWAVVSAKGYPGWYDLSERCAGTLGESWRSGISKNHHMFSSVGAWLYDEVAGFACDPIEPHIPEGFPNFTAWHDSPRGRLVTRWQDKKLTTSIE